MTDKRGSAPAVELEALAERPLISLVLPAFDTDPRYLRKAVASVRAQTYPDWELRIVDDGSARADTRRAIQRACDGDRRISATRLEENRGISAASNRGLELCEGELVGFLDHDDVLVPDALFEVARAFSEQETDVVYSDQDKISPEGRVVDPFLKPDWSPVYALGAMYVGHLLVIRRELIAEAGGLDSAFDTVQDFELLLRLSERTQRIHHIPRRLYHWRAIPGSIALGESEKANVTELQARAVNAHLRRRRIALEATPHPAIPHRLRARPAPGFREPSVSLVKVSRSEHGSFRPARLANAGAARATGDFLVFLGDDVEATETDWVEQLLALASIPGVGAVGPVLTHPDGLVDTAGFAIGLHDPAAPAMRGFPADGDGYYGSLSCAREVSAVGMDCMLIRRSLFEELGGFEEAYSRQFSDLDLCLRLAERGLSVICTPAPRTISHAGEATRTADFDVIDRGLFVDRFYERLEQGDPFYNPGFFPAAADYTLPPYKVDPQELAMREAVG